jgi:hypothetical protein
MLQVQFSQNRLASAGKGGREGKTKNEEYSMNKLVITAALLVAAASSYAQERPMQDVYSVVISMKTTKPNVAYVNGQEFVYRSVISKTINGFYHVDPYAGFDDSNYIELGYNGELLDGGVMWNNVVRIGKNNAEIEADGVIPGGNMIVFLRGFGTYDVKNQRVSSLNGSINAFLESPELNGNYVFGRDLSEPYLADTESESTIAFGTFSVKYSLEASKKDAAGEWDWFNRKMGIVHPAISIDVQPN